MKIKLRNSAAFWLLLYGYITMHGPQNIKYFFQYFPRSLIRSLMFSILNKTFRLNSHTADTRNDNDMKIEVIQIS
jgi:hypothetical protein